MNNYDSGWTARVVSRFAGAADIDSTDVAQLARFLAASGDVRIGRDDENDVASTGGPGSLTTFLSPLVLLCDGDRVPKVGVPGRPAGVVDTLANIAGYRVDLSGAVFDRVLEECGFANALATGRLAPADGQLFAARQAAGAQAVPALVAASLLSKKLAVGLRRCTIDIRVGPYGNFGTTVDAAESNARLLMEVGQHVGIEVTPVISTNASGQPYLGRFEALLGLQLILRGQASTWLAAHFSECVEIARRHRPERALSRVPDLRALSDAIDANLRAQGAQNGLDDLDAHVENKTRSATFEAVYADRSGSLSWDFEALRAAIVAEQRSERTAYADPGGVQLLTPSDTAVTRGEPIAIVRHEVVPRLESFVSAVRRAGAIAGETTGGP